MTGFCSWSEVYLVLINIEKKALYWQNSHFWPLLRRGAKLSVLSSGSKRWDPIRSINYGNVWKYTLNPNLKDCRKQKKKSHWKKRLTFSLFPGRLFWELNFVPPATSCHSLRDRDKLPVAAQILYIRTNCPLLVTQSGHTIRLSFASLHILDVRADLLDKASKNAIGYKSTNWAELLWFVASLSSQSWHHPLSEDVLVEMASRV